MAELYHKATGVFMANGPIACVSKDDIEIIKKDACSTPLRRSRICLHQDNADPVHEMIIALCHDSYIPPHSHEGKSESFHIIEGQADICFFDESGTMTDTVILGANSPQGFYYRLSSPLYHTVLSHGPMLVFHETTSGPFSPESNRIAPFAPPAANALQVQDYMQMLREQLALRQQG